MKKFTKVFAIALVVIMSLALLVACGPSADPKKAKANLEKAGYEVGIDTKVIPAVLGALGVKGIDGVLTGANYQGENFEHITIVYFLTADAASDAFETVQKYAEGEDGDSDSEDWICKKSGKMIYYGTEAAIKAA